MVNFKLLMGTLNQENERFCRVNSSLLGPQAMRIAMLEVCYVSLTIGILSILVAFDYCLALKSI